MFSFADNFFLHLVYAADSVLVYLAERVELGRVEHGADLHAAQLLQQPLVSISQTEDYH